MSFPQLILSEHPGSNNQAISGIGVSYGANLGDIIDVGPYMKRWKHQVQRVYTKDNVNYGTAPVKRTVPYDRVRLVHTFTGFVDVLSQSCSRYNGMTPQEETNMDLIENAIWYENANLSFDVKLFYPADIGAGNPSQGAYMEQGLAKAPTWTYDISGTPLTIARWLIKDINIVDNQNNTSRITFTFEAIQAQLNLVDILTT